MNLLQVLGCIGFKLCTLPPGPYVFVLLVTSCVTPRHGKFNPVIGGVGKTMYGLKTKNLMKIYIKYMVSLRCKTLVQEELDRMQIPFRLIEIGVVELYDDVTSKQREQLKVNLLHLGLKLHEAKKGILIEKIKKTIFEMIQYSDGHPVVSYSTYLSEKLEYDYTYLSNIFSEVNGISIQQFIILSKIEEVKELLLFSDNNLSEISYKLHYSSVAHLSGQFKKITGLSPSCYKLIRKKREGIMTT